MPYPYYQNNQYYMQNMQDLQNMREKIDRQMQQIQQQNQMQQQPVPNVTQNFQLAPNPSNNELESKYVNNIDEVKGIFVMKTGVFLNKELNTLWIKNTNGDIRTFELNEIIQTDPKDEEINNLKKELERMREMINYESNVNNSDNDESNESKNATKLSNNKRTNAKQK
ncbi:MAG: hypothetical protein II393_00275 [Cytophagales bacterium]|nr:hypothetical protein [Cytophagales bacterium]